MIKNRLVQLGMKDEPLTDQLALHLENNKDVYFENLCKEIDLKENMLRVYVGNLKKLQELSEEQAAKKIEAYAKAKSQNETLIGGVKGVKFD